MREPPAMPGRTKGLSPSSSECSKYLLLKNLFEVLRGRVLARVDRRGEELGRIEAPELAHVLVGGDDRVHEAPVLALDLAHVDVEDRLAVLVDADRADRARVQAHAVQGLHEGR